ncbi:MAG: SurA N-terminal domain-containing protein [Deltaproteobacteria bacterium]|nr:SurA N-terminal domain-containing protein [Deltaproteobacteria bacterium]
MLYLMRKHAASWMIKSILILVALSFVAWGGYRIREQRLIRIANVNGQPITINEYREAYNNILEQLRLSFGNSLNDEMIKLLRVDKQAMDRLINEKLLLQEARRLNFKVSDQELSDNIRKMAAFQNAGTFDSRRYRLVLNSARLSPEDFEAVQKDSMLIQKVRNFITDTVKVSDLEAWEWYKWQNISVNIDLVLFDPEKYKNIETSEEETAAYFNEHKESFKTEPKLKAAYLYFNPADYVSKVQVSQEEVDDYYERNREKFTTPKTVEARHILIKVAQDADESTVERAKKRALDILKQAREGKDFAELAKQYSEGPTRDQGGYLGVFERDAMVKPFSDKAFSMKPGEISEPVRTPFGWHIIKVEKVNEASAEPEGKAKEKIRKKLIEDKSKLFAYDHAESVYETIFDGDDLEKIAEQRDLTFRKTDFFTRKGPVDGIANSNHFVTVAFELSPMQISEVQDLGDGFYIIQVLEKIPSQIPEFSSVKEKVRSELIKEKQRQKAKADAASFLEALKNGKSLSEASKEFNLTPMATGFFKRNDSIPNIGYEPAVANAAFMLSEKNALPENAVEGRKGFFVIRFKERKEPSYDAFEKEKASTKQGLLELKKRKAFDSWLAQLRRNSDITIEKGILDE